MGIMVQILIIILKNKQVFLKYQNQLWHPLERTSICTIFIFANGTAVEM